MSDQDLVRAFLMANLRLYETQYLQVEQQLLGEEAMAALGWSSFGTSPVIQRMWPMIRSQITPDFAEYLEAAVPELRGR